MKSFKASPEALITHSFSNSYSKAVVNDIKQLLDVRTQHDISDLERKQSEVVVNIKTAANNQPVKPVKSFL